MINASIEASHSWDWKHHILCMEYNRSLTQHQKKMDEYLTPHCSDEQVKSVNTRKLNTKNSYRSPTCD